MANEADQPKRTETRPEGRHDGWPPWAAPVIGGILLAAITVYNLYLTTTSTNNKEMMELRAVAIEKRLDELTTRHNRLEDRVNGLVEREGRRMGNIVDEPETMAHADNERR